MIINLTLLVANDMLKILFFFLTLRIKFRVSKMEELHSTFFFFCERSTLVGNSEAKKFYHFMRLKEKRKKTRVDLGTTAAGPIRPRLATQVMMLNDSKSL